MKTLIALCIALFSSGFAVAASQEDEINRYVQIFAGDKSLHTAAVESLGWKGISDPRVFDPLEKHVLDEASEGLNDEHKKDQIAHYIRALGFSGQPKYAETIRKYSGEAQYLHSVESLYKRHAKIALEDLSIYEKWNPIISNRASFDPKYSDDVNRILNMLRSDDFKLKMMGAKRIYFSNKDDILLETLANEIRACYTRKEPQLSDPVAWMVKALGSAKQQKYRGLLQEVSINGNSKAVGYAFKALE